jgi:hypothetical protein
LEPEGFGFVDLDVCPPPLGCTPATGSLFAAEPDNAVSNAAPSGLPQPVQASQPAPAW